MWVRVLHFEKNDNRIEGKNSFSNTLNKNNEMNVHFEITAENTPWTDEVYLYTLSTDYFFSYDLRAYSCVFVLTDTRTSNWNNFLTPFNIKKKLYPYLHVVIVITCAYKNTLKPSIEHLNWWSWYFEICVMTYLRLIYFVFSHSHGNEISRAFLKMRNKIKN